MDFKNIQLLDNKQLSINEKGVLLTLINLASNDRVVKNYSLIELSNIMSVTKPTLIKVLNNLEEKGFIEKIKCEGRYAKNCYKICV